MISINAATQPATIPTASLPPSSFCSCVTSIGGDLDVASTSVLELIIKFIPIVELALTVNPMLSVEIVFVIKLVVLATGSEVAVLNVDKEIILAGSEDIILVEMTIESGAIIISLIKLVTLVLFAVTTHE